MDPSPTSTRDLLTRMHGGDEDALRDLVARHLPWIRACVHERLGRKLRQRAETQDFVHEAVVEVLRHGPRFTVSSDEHFRALLGRIVENVLRGKHRRWAAERRDAAQERPLPTESVLDLDPRRAPATTASAAVDRREREAWLRLGMELLRPEDREVVELRQEGLPFEEVGAELGVAANAARMRFDRALARLGALVVRLRVEGLEAVLEERRG